MKKVFNILVQVAVDGDDRQAIVNTLDNICVHIDGAADRESKGGLVGQSTVDGYWDSYEDYTAGADCHDDDPWTE